MSQWDDVKLSSAIQQKNAVQAMNREASALLPVNDNVVKTTTVINRRSGSKTTTVKSIYQINQEREIACKRKFWTREPRSNSNSFVFHTVQNTPGSDISKPEPIVLSRQLIKG
jgi:ABC-type phosphate transport system substrate-binding protein